jgi:hypothetical protein
MPQPQCTATAKATGQRCRRYARAGYAVCIMHGAGKGTKRGGRPPVHGLYSKFLRPEELADFQVFRQEFDLNADLALAVVKVYAALDKVKPEQLPALLETPGKIAERRKRILEGVTLKLDVDVAFLREFVAKVLTYVDNPTAQDELLTFVEATLGAAPGE